MRVLLRTLAASALLAGALPFSTSVIAAGDPTNFDIATLQNAGAFVTFGDAQSYSLQVACTQTGQTGTGCIWFAQGSPGQIADLVVNGVGSNPNAFDNPFNGTMDNAYALPNSSKNLSQNDGWFFRTGTQANTVPGGSGTAFPGPDPGGGCEWTGSVVCTSGGNVADTGHTWDSQLSSLMTYTQNKDPVFFFVNNQSNANSPNVTEADQTLAAWAQLWITNDATGQVLGVWDFTNHNCPYQVVANTGDPICSTVNPLSGGGVPGGPVPFGGSGVLNSGPDVVSNLNTDYVLSGGKLCFDFQTGNTAPALGDEIVSCSGSFDYFVDNNLGENQAAYALFFPDMNRVINDLILLGVDLSTYSIHADVRIGCDPAWTAGLTTEADIEAACSGKRLTNGPEAIFIGAAFERPPICVEFPDLPECQPPQVPEPGALALTGLALASLVLFRRRSVTGKTTRRVESHALLS